MSRTRILIITSAIVSIMLLMSLTGSAHATGSDVGPAIPASESGPAPVPTAPPRGVTTYGSTSALDSSEALLTHFYCTIYASDPWSAAGFIRGYGSQGCEGAVSATRLRVCIQRHRWWGWQTLDCVDTGWQATLTLNETVSSVCRAGTYTYRVVTTGFAHDYYGDVYSAEVQSANYLRRTC